MNTISTKKAQYINFQGKYVLPFANIIMSLKLLCHFTITLYRFQGKINIAKSNFIFYSVSTCRFLKNLISSTFCIIKPVQEPAGKILPFFWETTCLLYYDYAKYFNNLFFTSKLFWIDRTHPNMSSTLYLGGTCLLPL